MLSTCVAEVSRYDLFHGHVFRRQNGHLGILLHACEYPARTTYVVYMLYTYTFMHACIYIYTTQCNPDAYRNEESFDVNLGYCQAGSPVKTHGLEMHFRIQPRYDALVMRRRNLLVLLSGQPRAFVLDAESPAVKALIPEYARAPLYTLYEELSGSKMVCLFLKHTNKYITYTYII